MSSSSSFLMRQINKFAPKKIRSIGITSVLIPQAIVLGIYGFEQPKDFMTMSISSFQHYKEFDTPIMRNLILALMFERCVYTFVWFFPKHFQDFAKAYPISEIGHPVDVVVALFYVSKVLQMGGLASWYYYTAPWANMFEISAFQWVTGLQLILFGQLLNFSIYDAIGKNGVYYGNKFGVSIPWCTGFPFNVFTAHPQYCGAVATVFGVIVLLATEAHANAGIFAVGIIQALLYMYMALVEST